jgi:phenylacetic acid degradation operon negative regulatory protein
VSTDPAREPEANRILDELGLSERYLSFVATSGGIGARQDLVARAWDLRAVQASYGEFIGTFAPLDPANDRERMAAQTLLVHEWRRFPFLDPQLPRELLPAGWPGREAAALFAARHKRWQPGALRCWAGLASLAPRRRAAD